jgi:hypothetical protein
MSTFDKQLEQLLMGSELEEGQEPPETQPMEELVPVVYEEKQSALTLDNPDMDEDYKFARSNLYGLIGRSNAALDLALRIAQMSEHPRAIEVAANLMKTSADMSKDLIGLQQKMNSDKKIDKPSSYTQVNNNYYTEPKTVKDIDSDLDNLPDED